MLRVTLPNLGVPLLVTIGTDLPGAAALSMLAAIQPRLVNPGQGAVVLVVWVAVSSTAVCGR